MGITTLDLDEWFSYHPPMVDDVHKYNEIRKAAKQLAYAILQNAPQCADQSAAVRYVREAMMTANAAIACKGR